MGGKTSLWRFLFYLTLIAGCLTSPLVQSGEIDFSGDYERIFQIRVISNDAGSKSSIGSGFQVSSDGLLITNYHVVSAYVTSPDIYHLEYSNQDGTTGTVELLDFDVISDLAVLRLANPASTFFKLADTTPIKGEVTYALGNPGDWGVILVQGPTNGYVEHQYEKRVLFSGSLNPGMSGGPSLNRYGEVAGVNVATAGSQLSFLVPVEKVKRLLMRNKQLDAAQYHSEIAAQIKTWQAPRIQELLDSHWTDEEFMQRRLFNELRNDFKCWGDTNETNIDRVVEWVAKWCEAGDRVYINSDLDTGQIEYMFKHRKSVELNDMQFAKSNTLQMSADNYSDYDNSTQYKCQTDFVASNKNHGDDYSRIVTCIRAYKKLPGLYDSLLLVVNQQAGESFSAHLSLAGLEKHQIQSFHQLFMERTL